MSLVFGLSSVFLWRWLTFLEWHFFALYPEISLPNPFLCFTVFSVFHLISFLALGKYISLVSERLYWRFMFIAACFMSVSILPVAFGFSVTSTFGMLLFTLFPSSAAAIFLAVWQWRLFDCYFRSVGLVFGLSSVLGSFAITFSGCVPRSFMFVAVLALPFIGAALWRIPSKKRITPETFLYTKAKPYPYSILWRIAFFFITCAIFHSMLLVNINSETSIVLDITDMFYSFGTLTAGIIFYLFPNFDLRKIYHIAQTSLGFGFILFIAIGERYPVLPVAFLQFGYGVFGNYIFSLFIYLASHFKREEGLAVIARGQATVTASVIIGAFISYGIASMSPYAEREFLIWASLAGLVFMFLVAFFFGDNKETFAGYDLVSEEEKEEANEALKKTDEATDNKVAVDTPLQAENQESDLNTLTIQLMQKGFTKQEIRVALLVKNGVSNPDIALHLNITSNTLRTHLRNIHKKMGTTDRKTFSQDLNELSKITSH